MLNKEKKKKKLKRPDWPTTLNMTLIDQPTSVRINYPDISLQNNRRQWLYLLCVLNARRWLSHNTANNQRQ